MQFIYDNLTAALVAGVVLLTLAFLTTDRRQTTIDGTRFHAAREMHRTMAEMFERDVRNIGTGVPAGEPMILLKNATTFRFLASIDGGGSVVTIEYRRVNAGTTPDGAQTYRVERYVNGIREGGSSDWVTRFDVDLLTLNDAPVSSTQLMLTRKVVVRLETMVPYEESLNAPRRNRMPVRRLYWESVYRPNNLARMGV
jgi:hypothetical protein